MLWAKVVFIGSPDPPIALAAWPDTVCGQRVPSCTSTNTPSELVIDAPLHIRNVTRSGTSDYVRMLKEKAPWSLQAARMAPTEFDSESIHAFVSPSLRVAAEAVVTGSSPLLLKGNTWHHALGSMLHSGRFLAVGSTRFSFESLARLDGINEPKSRVECERMRQP